ncbi:hypothetical protein CEXT_369611 [Caerostris extrusa]|uniref:Uncharacterized protein n=1 Tax=Caerostris extrusa TaxID=172846 RepID=A0AAV4SYS4_CAEEX|nr:hypothetical protein CEXT_369611 [Caerostris extrusa]
MFSSYSSSNAYSPSLLHTFMKLVCSDKSTAAMHMDKLATGVWIDVIDALETNLNIHRNCNPSQNTQLFIPVILELSDNTESQR